MGGEKKKKQVAVITRDSRIKWKVLHGDIIFSSIPIRNFLYATLQKLQSTTLPSQLVGTDEEEERREAF